MKKRKGMISWSVSIFVFALLFLLIVSAMQLQEYNAVKIFTEDALAASNLASAVIDLQEYGISHDIVIADPDSAYRLYREAMQVNMKLDNGWESNNDTIAGAVVVLDYIIYNVKDMDVEIYSYGQNTYSTVVENGLGSVSAPNGQLIESTSVYSRITFPVEGIFEIRTDAVKDKLVDIVNINN